MELTKFWFVWNPAARAPQYRHGSKALAQQEAERLAALHPGQQFIVLKAVGGAVAPNRPIESIVFVPSDADDIPF